VRALTIKPGEPNSVRLDDIDEPPATFGGLLIRTLALGVCATDRDLIAGEVGEAPQFNDRLVIGHESYGEVIEAPTDSGFKTGDRIVGIVRQPDPEPCPSCTAGEWDMCSNGHFSEHGIKRLHGFGSERFRIAPEFAVKVDAGLGDLGVLLEPASIVAKAWDHIERIGHRFRSWHPQRVLIVGAGPIGVLAALLGKQRGCEVHVFDRNIDGPKPPLIRDLGARFHSGRLDGLRSLRPDIVVECTGVAEVVADAITAAGPNGSVCLLGICGSHTRPFNLGAFNDKLMMENNVVFGAVNANRTHFEMAHDALVQADRQWLARIITRRVPLAHFGEALTKKPGDIKVVIDFAA